MYDVLFIFVSASLVHLVFLGLCWSFVRIDMEFFDYVKE